MASSGGNSSACTKSQSSGSEGDLQNNLNLNLMDQRKNKRKQSNRESARRSRMRKQKHMDEMMGQVSQLTKDNSEILTSINITTQHYLNVEAENSILRAQVGELSQRLQSLNDILSLINNTTSSTTGSYNAYATRDWYHHQTSAQKNGMNMPHHLNQPIMASADIFQW